MVWEELSRKEKLNDTRKDVIIMSRAQDKKKSNSLTGIEPRPSAHWLDALTTELQRPHGKLPHVQG